MQSLPCLFAWRRAVQQHIADYRHGHKVLLGVEHVDTSHAQGSARVDQIGLRQNLGPGDRPQVVDLQFRGGRGTAFAEVVDDGVPHGFIGDGGHHSAVQHARLIQQIVADVAFDIDAVFPFPRNPDGEPIFESHDCLLCPEPGIAAATATLVAGMPTESRKEIALRKGYRGDMSCARGLMHADTHIHSEDPPYCAASDCAVLLVGGRLRPTPQVEPVALFATLRVG